MTDTPQNIKAIQLKIWLSKPPMERLRQMMIDNEALIQFWSVTHKSDKNQSLTSSGLTSPLPPL
jgi:hypothetical protein